MPDVEPNALLRDIFDIPEVVALPISGGNQDHLSWLDEETD